MTNLANAWKTRAQFVGVYDCSAPLLLLTTLLAPNYALIRRVFVTGVVRDKVESHVSERSVGWAFEDPSGSLSTGRVSSCTTTTDIALRDVTAGDVEEAKYSAEFSGFIQTRNGLTKSIEDTPMLVVHRPTLCV